jgi:hypothetical protein
LTDVNYACKNGHGIFNVKELINRKIRKMAEVFETGAQLETKIRNGSPMYVLTKKRRKQITVSDFFFFFFADLSVFIMMKVHRYQFSASN